MAVYGRVAFRTPHSFVSSFSFFVLVRDSERQNVEPTANRNVNFLAGWKLLSSTPPRCGFIAKINRNGTLSTGMKNRTSAPVEVLNALVWPITRVVGPGGAGQTPGARHSVSVRPTPNGS